MGLMFDSGTRRRRQRPGGAAGQGREGDDRDDSQADLLGYVPSAKS